MKHTFLYFQCIGKLYYLLYKWTTATFYIFLFIVISYKKYNIVYGIVSYKLPHSSPIKVYKYFVLIMDSHRFGTQKELFIYFCNLVTVYLNRREKLRNRTNHEIVVFWCYIGIYILISIYHRISC